MVNELILTSVWKVQLCAGSWGGKLPNDLDGFIDFSESTYREKPYPEYFTRCLDLLYEVKDQMKCSKVTTSGYPTVSSSFVLNSCLAPRVYTRYHLGAGLPHNWVAIGDSVMSLNPIYGRVFAFSISLPSPLIDKDVRKLPSALCVWTPYCMTTNRNSCLMTLLVGSSNSSIKRLLLCGALLLASTWPTLKHAHREDTRSAGTTSALWFYRPLNYTCRLWP